MRQGINRATQGIVLREFSNFSEKNKPCIFLSHINLDKNAVIKVGNYIKKAGLDIYLDIDDPALQKAVRDENDIAITEFIEKGINTSTHILSILSEKTKDSWWVPYEIGYGKKGGKKLATMPLKNLPEKDIPSYIKVTHYITGISSLNNFLKQIILEYSGQYLKLFDKYQDHAYEISSDASIIQESYSFHPLTDYLKQ